LRGRRRGFGRGHVIDGVDFGDLLGAVAREATIATSIRRQSHERTVAASVTASSTKLTLWRKIG
jgi:hypothetical protein